MKRIIDNIRRAAAGALVAGAVLLVAPTALAESQPVQAPAIPGVAGLPGPIAPAARPAATMNILTTKPDSGVAGRKMTIAGGGLQPNKPVSVVWMTGSVSWMLDARPDSIDYTGRKVDKFGVVIATATTDANGSFLVPLKVPHDFGGIHDIYAVIDGLQVSKGGFLLNRQMSISPKRGPIGTPITVHFSGLAYSLYDSGGAFYWDNKYLGAFTGNTTRGSGSFVVRATGPVGRHQIVSGPAITVDYLNAPQSPQPWQPLFSFGFTVTKDAGRPAASLDWPAQVTPTVGPTTTLTTAGLTAAGATASLTKTSGTVLSKVGLSATGLTPGAPVQLAFSTVVGNRVNCTGTCWALASVPLGSATVSATGTVNTNVTIPDGLGGWHVIQVLQDGKAKAQVPFFVERSLVSMPKRVKVGERFTIHLKGVGWTQLDNTAAVTYDNSYIGYGCGFNSNGDVELNLVATGEPGTHLIDLWPMLYTQNPIYANAAEVYGMVPFLSYAQDAPGLALGYRLPAMRLAITVVR
jgi:hypothetical protein